jgi:hypothetical protein
MASALLQDINGRKEEGYRGNKTGRGIFGGNYLGT